MAAGGRLRIGELSRRVGESPELLRAWETRYGLVTPERSPGGLRLYSEEDERRIRSMRRHIDAGLSASEAARMAKGGDPPAPESLDEIGAALERSFAELDEPAAQVALDRAFGVSGVAYGISEVILPLLRRFGSDWASHEKSVADEHFASNVIGGRLRGLARDWGQGIGAGAILACPPGELHELGLLAFGLLLREQGWRITYFGAETPVGDIAGALGRLRPAIVVLAAVTPQRFLDSAAEIAALAARVRVAIGGAGASPPLAETLGVELLGVELVDAAAALTP